MQLIVGKIISIFLIAGIGFIANKVGILPISANNYIANFLLRVTMPCMILASITSNDLKADMLITAGQTIIGAAAFFAFATFIGYFLCNKMLKVSPLKNVGVYTFSFAAVNNGFIGFPITAALFGSNILYLMVVHNIGLTLYLYSFGLIVLGLGTSEGRLSSKGFLRSLYNINTIAALIGIAMLVAGINLPAFIFESIDMIGDSTTPLSMILVGMQLGQCEFGEFIKNKKLVFISIIKMAILPVSAFLMVNWLPFAAEVKICLVFAASFPTAVAVVPIVNEQNRDCAVAAEMVAITTLLSLISIAATAAFLTQFFGL